MVPPAVEYINMHISIIASQLLWLVRTVIKSTLPPQAPSTTRRDKLFGFRLTLMLVVDFVIILAYCLHHITLSLSLMAKVQGSGGHESDYKHVVSLDG